MSDFKHRNAHVGFSTGALEQANYRSALSWLSKHNFNTVELSALRLSELAPLVDDLEKLPITSFSYISFHAPSSFAREEESQVVELLKPIFRRGWNVVVHPDVIRKPSLWKGFGKFLLIENMDRRKSIGRTAEELERVFRQLPDARLCLDVAHARQLDTTLTTLVELIWRFKNRIAEIHISELDSECRHQPMSWCAMNDYQTKALNQLNGRIPTIIESMLDGDRAKERKREFEFALKAVTGSDTVIPQKEVVKNRISHNWSAVTASRVAASRVANRKHAKKFVKQEVRKKS